MPPFQIWSFIRFVHLGLRQNSVAKFDPVALCLWLFNGLELMQVPAESGTCEFPRFLVEPMG